MSMYNLSEYSNNYLKTYGSICQYYRDKPNDFLANSESFRFQLQITTQNPDDVPVKYLCNVWRILEMLLISCEISLNLI